MSDTIGLVGLGTLGRVFAGHLAAAGHRVVAHDPGDHAVDGVERVADPAEVARRAAVVVLALPSPAAVRDAVAGLRAAGRDGLLVVDTSTIDPETARAAAADLAADGGGYVEAPLSGAEPFQGGLRGAEAASVTFMVGGAAADVERARPVLGILGKHVFHLGPAGTGSEVKLISNMCSGVYALVTAEAFAAGAALGIPAERLLEVFQHTDAKSFFMTDYVLPRLAADDLDEGFAVRLQLKDHRLFRDLAARLGVPAPLNEHAVRAYEAAAAAGDAERDVSVVARRAIDAAPRAAGAQ